MTSLRTCRNIQLRPLIRSSRFSCDSCNSIGNRKMSFSSGSVGFRNIQVPATATRSPLQVEGGIFPKRKIVTPTPPLVVESRRYLWGWLNSIFNRVDKSRIEEVGPDRACAEWLLRCGAGIKWDKGAPEDWLRDYNSLPVGNYRGYKIVEVDATDSAVMHIGFPHFEGLTKLKRIIFHRCMYLEDEAVRRVGVYLKDTLEELQISSCGNVTDEGILTLVQMKNLKKLKLYDLLEVRNRQNCLSVLKSSLPNCDIHFPFAREEDKDPESKDPAINIKKT